jgi:UDP-glucose 4-epimerase
VTTFDQTVRRDSRVREVVGDLRNIDDVREAAKSAEVICHVGAIGDVYLAGEQPTLAAEVNASGSANIGQAAAEQGARVVYASTWEVYGEPQYQPLDEAHPTNPDHPYNITKLTGESLLLAADRLHDVPVTSLRLGTAYGSGLRPNSVFRIFIDRAKREEPLTIQGDGSQIRQFTHASDIARGFQLAAEAGLRETVLNLVAPEATSIRRLAELVVDRFPTELTFGDPRPGDVPPAKVSSTKAKEVLGWEAKMAFEDGLDELISSLEG